MLSPNVVIPYDGTHASIPTGFDRETSLDDKFPKGWGTEAVSTSGGATTHTHTTASHEHEPSNHPHAVQSVTSSGNPDKAAAGDRGSNRYHLHSGTTSTTSITSQTNSTPTWGSSSNNPPYYEVLFIKANSYQLVPQNGLVLSSSLTRSGMTFHTSSGGKFLKGAATDGNAGDTGGSYDNTHDIGHTHAAGHGHGGTSGGTPQKVGGPGATGTSAPPGHTHPINLDEKLTTLNENAPDEVTVFDDSGGDIEPEYRTLNAFYSVSGSTAPLKGDVCMWTDAPADIPLGWKLSDGTDGTVDMQDKFIKIPSTATATSTDGSNTHTHSAVAHTHSYSSASHTHTGSLGSNSDSIDVAHADPDYRHFPGHTHGSLTYVASKTVSYGSGTMTPDSSANQPEYITVVYIEFIYSTVGGSFLVNLI